MSSKRLVVALVVLVTIMALIFWYNSAAGKWNGNSGKQAAETGEDSLDAGTRERNKEDILKGMLDIPMEDFEATDLNGNKVKLSDYKGKIIFLNFWATWCPPCRDEMPFFEQLHNEYKDQDVVILAVNSTSVELRGGTDSSRAENIVRAFIDSNRYTFPVLLDKDDKAWSIYFQRGIPANYIIDKNGVIRYGFAGAFQNKEQMVELIENIRAIE